IMAHYWRRGGLLKFNQTNRLFRSISEADCEPFARRPQRLARLRGQSRGARCQLQRRGGGSVRRSGPKWRGEDFDLARRERADAGCRWGYRFSRRIAGFSISTHDRLPWSLACAGRAQNIPGNVCVRESHGGGDSPNPRSKARERIAGSQLRIVPDSQGKSQAGRGIALRGPATTAYRCSWTDGRPKTIDCR